MKIFDTDTSIKYRMNYIQTFIDTNSERYRSDISNPRKYIDGYCYSSYLWDSLKKPCVSSEEHCEEILKLHKKLLVLWDIHSCENIFIEDYWKFPKSAVIELTYEEYVLNKDKFVEDLYFFDETYKWSAIFTHEYVEQQKRFCYVCKI